MTVVGRGVFFSRRSFGGLVCLKTDEKHVKMKSFVYSFVLFFVKNIYYSRCSIGVLCSKINMILERRFAYRFGGFFVCIVDL